MLGRSSSPSDCSPVAENKQGGAQRWDAENAVTEEEFGGLRSRPGW